MGSCTRTFSHLNFYYLVKASKLAAALTPVYLPILPPPPLMEPGSVPPVKNWNIYICTTRVGVTSGVCECTHEGVFGLVRKPKKKKKKSVCACVNEREGCGLLQLICLLSQKNKK